MKTKRLYYDCPLQAAYMAKNFGVEFIIQENGILDEYEGVISWDRRHYFFENEGIKWVIYEESLHIFEPQDGDRDEEGCVFDSGSAQWFAIDPSGYHAFADNHVDIDKKKRKIAFRNSKHFFWPKEDKDA